jgi:hypothetical protein
MKTSTCAYFILHFILAFFPLIIAKWNGGLRTEWWVIPCLVLNGFIQGGVFMYRIDMITWKEFVSKLIDKNK